MNQDEAREEILKSYDFAKEQNFDSIVIVIESESGTFEISEYENGFISGSFDCVYDDIEEIAKDLLSTISGEIYDIRIE